jgi:hypothetical protein
MGQARARAGVTTKIEDAQADAFRLEHIHQF